MSINRVSSFFKPKLRIRTKLILSAVTTISLALIVVLTISLQYRNVGRAIRTEQFAHQVIKDVSDLNSLSYAYLLLKDKRPKVQWQLKHTSIGKLLSEDVAATPYEQAIIVRLRSSYERMKDLFDVIVKNTEESHAGAEEASSSYDELNEGIVAQLLAHSERMVYDASLLGRDSARRMNTVRQRSYVLVIVSAFILVGSAVLTASFLAKSIGSSIRSLERGTQRIASGDLAHRVEVGGNDEITHLAAAFNDMTARLRVAENDRESYIRKLAQSNRELEEFAFVASHDLQEPLRKIQAFGDRLKEKFATDLKEDGLDYLNRMLNASLRMQDLIQSLLIYSRVASRPESFSQVSLASVVQGVVSDLAARIEETGGRVEVDKLPVIEASSHQMRQLFQNLLGNSLKFRREEPPLIRVTGNRISGTASDKHDSEEPWVEIRVEDNGIGFDEKYLDRIFAPFQRLHGRSQYEGTGMGLAICRKILERHGGTITAKSTPGKGATFIITIPVKHTSEGQKNEESGQQEDRPERVTQTERLEGAPL